MRILKYLFLLLLLSLVASSIFVATQKGAFSVERSKIINSPKSAVFNYVNDYRNWEDFGSWAIEDPEMKMTYPGNTIGKGATYSWTGKDGDGNMQTLSVKENESIVQKMNYNGTESEVFWSFKDTLGGTKVTWKTVGKMGFVFKIYAALNGGAEKTIGTMYEKSLANLDKKLDYEINTYAVKVNGLTTKLATFYLHQSFTSKISKITKNARIVFPRLISFCEQNNITMNGKPFILYHTFNSATDLAKISLCVPIKDSIYTSAGSDILSGQLKSFQAIKTTLTGDYSHNEKALEKAKDYFKSNKLAADPVMSHLEVYSIGKNEINNPSKWVTEIYSPIRPKIVAKKAAVVIVPETQEITTPKVVTEEESEF